MKSYSSAYRLAMTAVLLAISARQALAAPPDFVRDYVFIPAKTTVHVSGGSPTYDLNLTIAGKFGLVTGYDEEISATTKVQSLVPRAEFTDVHGILYNPLSLAPLPVPGWDLNKTLNLSGLKRTFSADEPNRFFFLGADGAGVALRLEADVIGPFLHLFGGSSDPPSRNAVLYQINALAHLTPFPDFNGDSVITVADIQPMLIALTDPVAFLTQHHMSSDDLLTMADMDGAGQITNRDLQGLLDMAASQSDSSMTPVPEPAVFVLLCSAALVVLAEHAARQTFGRWMQMGL
jgi:hypothetical protein